MGVSYDFVLFALPASVLVVLYGAVKYIYA